MSRWHVLGLGNLGTLCAARLLEAGQTVVAVPRQPASHMSRTLHRPARPPLTLTLPCCADEPIDRLLVTVKAPATATALMPVLPRLGPGTTLICLQNGMGTLEGIPLPEGVQIIHATTTDGAWRDADQVHVVAENTTLMGDGSGTAPSWFDALQPYWPGLEWRRDIQQALWRKLAVNAVINPLTALYRCRNGALLDNAERQQMMAALAAEVDLLGKRLMAHWPEDTLSRSVEVARQTAGNTSSMLADVLAGRPTEIDYINGFLLRRAREVQLSLPGHLAVMHQLKAMSH